MSGWTWTVDKFNQFLSRINKLEDDAKGAKADIKQQGKDLNHVEKRLDHFEKVVSHTSAEVAALQKDVKELKAEKHSLATRLGIQKAKTEKLAAPPLPLGLPEKKPRARKN